MRTGAKKKEKEKTIIFFALTDIQALDPLEVTLLFSLTYGFDEL